MRPVLGSLYPDAQGDHRPRRDRRAVSGGFAAAGSASLGPANDRRSKAGGALPNTMSAVFQPTMMAGASRLPGVMVGNTKESITLRVSVTNSYSRGDREFDQAPRNAFPK